MFVIHEYRFRYEPCEECIMRSCMYWLMSYYTVSQTNRGTDLHEEMSEEIIFISDCKILISVNFLENETCRLYTSCTITQVGKVREK